MVYGVMIRGAKVRTGFILKSVLVCHYPPKKNCEKISINLLKGSPNEIINLQFFL